MVKVNASKNSKYKNRIVLAFTLGYVVDQIEFNSRNKPHNTLGDIYPIVTWFHLKLESKIESRYSTFLGSSV